MTFKIFSLIRESSVFQCYVSGYRFLFVIPVWESQGFWNEGPAPSINVGNNISHFVFGKSHLFCSLDHLLWAVVHLLYMKKFGPCIKIFLGLFSIPIFLSFTFPSTSLWLILGFLVFSCLNPVHSLPNRAPHWLTFFFLDYLFILEKESAWAGEGQRESGNRLPTGWGACCRTHLWTRDRNTSWNPELDD